MCFFGVLLTAACSGLRILLKDATYFFDPLDSNLFWSSHLSLGGYLFFFFFFFFLGGYVFFFDPLDSRWIC